MKNPKVKIIPSAFDFILEAITILLIFVSFALPFIYSDKLKGEIPTHYNLLGQPDKWNQHGTIWIFPGIGLIIFVLVTVMNRYPYLFRYPVKVTASNAQYLYSLGTRTVSVLKLLVAALILCVTFESLKIGLRQTSGISKFCIPAFSLSAVLLFVVMISKMRRSELQKNSN